MSDNTPESNQDSATDTNSETKSISDKYSDVMGKINETIGNVDWTQMGKYGKAAGIIAVVVIAQIIIKDSLSVRDLEKILKNFSQKKPLPNKIDPNIVSISKRLSDNLGLKEDEFMFSFRSPSISVSSAITESSALALLFAVNGTLACLTCCEEG